jgi:putative aldouronate transport system substrate-binding protein
MLEELKIGGKIYFQPVGWGEGYYPNMGLIHVRKDLLDKYGMEPPDTFDQYFEFLKTCQARGDGSGVVFAGSGGVGPSINAFVGAYGAPMRGWVKKDGAYEYWAIQPGVKQGLLLFREMVARGLVDPGVWEMDGDKARAAYVSGGACSLIFNGGGHTGRIQNDMALVNETFQNWLLPALDAGASSRGYTSEEMFWGTSQLGGLKGNNPVAAARVINYLISDEGYKLTAVGIEGRDYEVVEGEIVMLPQRTKDGFPTEAGDTGAHPLATCIVSWQPQEWQDWSLLYGKDQAYKNWYKQMWENQGKYQIPTYGLLTTSPLWNKFQATSNDLVNIAFLEVVKAASEEEAAARFDQFVQEWLAAGGAEAQAEMSQKLSELYD